MGTGAFAALVDIVALVLLFLLRAWSSDPPMLLEDESLVLPRSALEEPVVRRLALQVSRKGIWMDGERLTGSTVYLQTEATMIQEVYQQILQRGNPPMDVVIGADVPFVLTRKVLYTLKEAGVRDVSLLAESRAGL